MKKVLPFSIQKGWFSHCNKIVDIRIYKPQLYNKLLPMKYVIQQTVWFTIDEYVKYKTMR